MYLREVRWIIYCDEYGIKSEPVLQFRHGKYGYWEDVPTIEVKTFKSKDGEK